MEGRKGGREGGTEGKREAGRLKLSVKFSSSPDSNGKTSCCAAFKLRTVLWRGYREV